ncbi:MAG: IS256 family transposase [Planctomycetota bacterium]|nr:IS256 family transposase [Planctomycetota bacterium]
MSSYQTVTPADTQAFSEFLSKHGQMLLPMVQLIEQSRTALDDVIDVTGRAMIEMILQVSADTLAGVKSPGKKRGDIRHHGSQDGVVHLKERKLCVRRPRLRHRTDGEVDIPAYQSLRTRPRMAQRMMQIMIDGVSTRRYKDVIPRMAESVGISKSAVSRANIEAGEVLLKELAERRFDHLDILIIYLDAIVLGDFHVLGAIGVDGTGAKHVLGLRPGSSENAVVATELLNDLVSKGVKPDRHRLFVIDGAKALRNAIDAVYGSQNPVQRCRIHKVRNVVGHLPKDQHRNARSTLAAAWKLDAKEGRRQVEQLARWHEKKYPSAAASLREGLNEMFTINAMNLPGQLMRCVSTTNIIESAHWGARQRVGRVRKWQSESMALRWSRCAFEAASKQFRKVMGHQQLWMLKAHLDAMGKEAKLEQAKQVG